MKHLFAGLLFTVIALEADAQAVFCTNNVAIRGYDPVAYFMENKPVEGSKEFSHSWQGVTWNFKNQANLDLFKENPEKYAPQFGGYCAYGVSENHKSPTDPAAFTIVDNKLYLNYSTRVKELWSRDRAMHIKRAEGNWADLSNKK